jgi:DNA-binding response OmpR family regulator
MDKRILIIDDEPETMREAEALLTQNGHQVSICTKPAEGLKRIKDTPPDLLLLDIRMPEIDGFEVCKRLKSDPATRGVPIIVLSVQNDEPNVVLALELGAEDFISKPIRKWEFMARIKSVFRRHGSEPVINEFKTGPFRIDFEHHTAHINNKPVDLGPKEFQLLSLFAQHEGRILTRAAISEKVWKTAHLPTSRAIDVRINELRKKLGDYGKWIVSLKGIGYRFEIEEE